MEHSLEIKKYVSFHLGEIYMTGNSDVEMCMRLNSAFLYLSIVIFKKKEFLYNKQKVISEVCIWKL